MKKLLCFLVPLSIAMYSCEEENSDGSTLNPDEASAEMNVLANKANQDITTMVESEGVKAVLDLIDLVESYDFTTRNNQKQQVKAQINEFFQKFVSGPSARTSNDDITSFDDIKGLYVWNSSTGTFDEFESEFFIVQFPTEGSSENNAEFKILALELITITEDYGDFVDEYQLPTLISSGLFVDDVEVISLFLVAQWSDDGFPNVANIDLEVVPFSYSLGFDNLGATTSSLLSSLKLRGAEILGIDVDVEFESVLKEEPVIIEGLVRYYNLKVSGKLDATRQDETEDINELIDLELLIDDEKVGDIIFIEDIAYVQYLDGTTEELEALFEAAIADLNDLVEDLD